MGKFIIVFLVVLLSLVNGLVFGFELKIGYFLKFGDFNWDRFWEFFLDVFKKCCSEFIDEYLKIVKSMDFVKVILVVEIVLFFKLGFFNGKEKVKYRYKISLFF